MLMNKQGGGKYLMRIEELGIKPIKPKPPMTPSQARINSLKQGVQRSQQQLQAEREQQRQKKASEKQADLARKAAAL